MLDVGIDRIGYKADVSTDDIGIDHRILYRRRSSKRSKLSIDFNVVKQEAVQHLNVSSSNRAASESHRIDRRCVLEEQPAVYRIKHQRASIHRYGARNVMDFSCALHSDRIEHRIFHDTPGCKRHVGQRLLTKVAVVGFALLVLENDVGVGILAVLEQDCVAVAMEVRPVVIVGEEVRVDY